MLTADEAQGKLLAALTRTQELAESRMRWSCRVFRHPGEDAPWIEDEHGDLVPPAPREIYRGPWRSQTYRPHPATVDVGGAPVTKSNPDAHLPAVDRFPALAAAGVIVADFDAQPFRTDDVIVHEMPNGDVRAYRVTDSNYKTDQTAQRLPVEDADVAWLEVEP